MDIEYLKKIYEYRHTKNVWRSDHGSFEFKECDALNRKLFNKPLQKMSKCECVEIFFFELQVLLMNPNLETKLKQMENQQFIFKKGKVLKSHNLSTAYTSANMTDEIAISLLKKSKSYISLFESYPKNWEDIVSGKNSKVEEKEVVSVNEVEEVKTKKKSEKSK